MAREDEKASGSVVSSCCLVTCTILTFAVREIAGSSSIFLFSLLLSPHLQQQQQQQW
jgi:hypothetical protein